MYDLIAYGAMIADKGRTSAYARALERLVTPDAVVLDIGTGAGIMAFLACRAGAARVYAVEPTGVVDVARAAAVANGFADRIEFIRGVTTDLELPERVDGIVADIHGVLPLFQQSAVSIMDARDRFLRPGGWIIPARETLWGAVVSCASAHDAIVGAWNTEYGFDLSAARSRAASQFRRHRFPASDLLVAGQRWAALDYARLPGPNVSGEVSCTMDRAASAHGLAVWFDTETAPGLDFSNSPASTEEHIFAQAFFPWPEALHLSSGDAVHVGLRADLVGDDYVWTWNTDVNEPGSGRVKASYRQSSLFAQLLASDDLRKRAHTFVPELNDDSRLDRHILNLMDRKIPLGEIATQILETFPAVFRDWNAAMGQVGRLSARYSR